MKTIQFNWQKYLGLIAAVVLGSLSVGCVSMSSLQTARTLPEGQSQQSFGGGVYQSKMGEGENTVEANLPYVEYTYRRGLTNNIDWGAKVALGSYGADLKYNFISGDQFALAAGLGLGYSSYKISSGGADNEYTYLDIHVPLYLSYDISKSFVVYASPKFVQRNGSGSAESVGLTGLTIGTKLGEKSGVYAEATMFKGDSSDQVTQYNLSYFW